MLAMFRCTKTSPGWRPITVVSGTRESEHPNHTVWCQNDFSNILVGEIYSKVSQRWRGTCRSVGFGQRLLLQRKLGFDGLCNLPMHHWTSEHTQKRRQLQIGQDCQPQLRQIRLFPAAARSRCGIVLTLNGIHFPRKV